MTVETTEATLQTQEITSQESNQQTEIVSNPDAVLAKNRELLGKTKKLKDELAEMQEWKRQQELADQERKGDLQGVIESLREENSKLKTEKGEVQKNYAFTTFSEQIKRAAAKEGCTNPDKLLKLMTAEQMKSVEVDDSFRVNGDDLTRLMDTLKEEHSDIGLFKRQNVNIHTVTGQAKVEDKTIANMSKEEIMAYARKNL